MKDKYIHQFYKQNLSNNSRIKCEELKLKLQIIMDYICFLNNKTLDGFKRIKATFSMIEGRRNFFLLSRITGVAKFWLRTVFACNLSR